MIPQLTEQNILNKTLDSVITSNERVLVASFQKRKNKFPESTIDFYKNHISQSNWSALFSEYPVATNMVANEETKKRRLIETIISRFSHDYDELRTDGIIQDVNLYIKNIEIGAGDLHRGMSTAIVELSNDQKIIFKPTGATVSEALFSFLDWINSYASLGHYKFKFVDKQSYQWIEYVDYLGCNTEEELQTYYTRAGYLIAIVYLLDGFDYHCENLIAHGSTPVLIDHETITQPSMGNKYQKYFKTVTKSVEESVLKGHLLPKRNKESLMPVGMCGLGYHKEKEQRSIQKVGINRFSDSWKMVTKFVTTKLYGNNIPFLDGEKKYPHEYIDYIIAGFEELYTIILNEQSLLRSENSPLRSFDHARIRFIWRPTNIYGKIKARLKMPENLQDFHHYENKLRAYLSKAFENVSAGQSGLNSILESEISQMLKGDIPYFDMVASSKDLQTDSGIINDFFELNCRENTIRKLDRFSLKDLERQKEIIKESILD